MPTQQLKTVGTSSRDYATWALAEAALPASLVTDDENWIFEAYDDSTFNPSGRVTFSSTTDSTRDIVIRPASGEGFKDNITAGTDRLVINNANGVYIDGSGFNYFPIFEFDSDDVTMEGMQLEGADWALESNGDNVIIRKNIFLAQGNYYGQGVIDVQHGEVSNNLVLALGQTSGWGLTIGYDAPAGVEVVNNTVCYPSDATANTGEGIRINFGTHRITNNLVLGFGSGFTNNSGTVAAGSDKNVTDDSSFPTGITGTSSATYADEIEGTTIATFDATLKSGADSAGYADREQTYTDDEDILETSRDTSSPDTGCYEIPSAAVTRDQEAFRFYDDGTEAGATALAAQNTDISIAKETTFQLSVGMQTTGDAPSEDVTLQYRLSGSSQAWRDVD